MWIRSEAREPQADCEFFRTNNMSLTYQPFAQTPAVERLNHDLHMNVSDGERLLGGVLGFGVVAAGLSRDGLVRWGYCSPAARCYGAALRGTARSMRNSIWINATADPPSAAIEGLTSKRRSRSRARPMHGQSRQSRCGSLDDRDFVLLIASVVLRAASTAGAY